MTWLDVLAYAVIFFMSIGVVAFLFFLWYLFTGKLLKRRYSVENDKGRRSEESYPGIRPVEANSSGTGGITEAQRRELLEAIKSEISKGTEQSSPADSGTDSEVRPDSNRETSGPKVKGGFWGV